MSLIPKKGTVYVVDDDEAVRDSLQWLLEGKDYRVRCFDSAETFLSRYDPREVACLIVDIRMGGMTGLELQDRLIAGGCGRCGAWGLWRCWLPWSPPGAEGRLVIDPGQA